MFRISQLARKFGLSRSSLLYYDRIGLLSPSARNEAGYRIYSTKDLERLDAVCTYRRAGLAIEDIARLLDQKGDGIESVLKRRLKTLGEEIAALQAKQSLLARMLKIGVDADPRTVVDKETWVAMLRAAGMGDEAMKRWHVEFERRAPEAHHRFLTSLGIEEKEALAIRRISGRKGA